jgi:phosphate transport system permease protein
LTRVLFMMATALAIIVLVVLLVTIINESFGLVAVQNEVPPDTLVTDYQTGRVLGGANVVSSEDDQALADRIAADPDATGFFGYAFFANNADKLKALAIDGVEPSAETANSGAYPFTRPLYIYTTADIIAENPQVAAYINYYLNNVNQAVESIGYFPAGSEAIDASRQATAAALGITALSDSADPAAVTGDIFVSGSSTVFPVSQAIADEFQAGGFQGDISISSIGTGGGFNAFCVEGQPDLHVVNASRPISNLELEACRASGREPLELRIGTDALAVVVNSDNDFATDVSLAELQMLFTDAANWSEVDPAWPERPIKRFTPTELSGTMDFFVEHAFDEELQDLPKEALVAILADTISVGLGRRLEREQLFFEDRLVFEDPKVFNELCGSPEPPEACFAPIRTQEEVYQLVLERVVVPTVVESWFLIDSILNRPEIVLEAHQKYAGAEIEFRSWLSPEFIINAQSSEPELAGVRTAILGTLMVIGVTIFFSFPLGVGAAIYLEEYADQGKWYNRVIQTNINNLAGVPSIIYGMLGLAVFVRVLEPLTSGAIFGIVDVPATANGRTILAAGMTLGLLILPIIIIAAQESIRAVPSSLRQASFGLGATRWQTIWHHVLPSALPGILTGTILSISRAVGETAPLVVIGASTFITVDPSGPFSKFTVLPIQIFQWTTRPQGAFRNIAAAAIIVLLVLLLALNASAVYLRNRYSARYA